MKHLHDALDNLIEKYKHNEYITGRLEIYMSTLLQTALDSEDNEHMKKVKRKQTLNRKRYDFIERFLNKNSYYYCSNSKLFLYYDGLHYVGHSEDDIQHNVLTTITAENQLTPWKYRIRNDIICAIKQRSPLNTIPDSKTIQYVINILCPKLFTSRNLTKYFLTLLGDNILNKEDTNSIYIISPSAKEIIKELGNSCNMHFGSTSVGHNIKYKYYDHDYERCRLLDINNDYIEHYTDLPREISKYIIDIIAVATHYSSRHVSADKFLQQLERATVADHILYLTNNTQESIVQNFIDSCLETCVGTNIETKNIIFIWNKFLKEKNLPSIMFHDTFKKLLQNKLEYSAESDHFTNITSISLPLVASVVKFWDTTIIDDPNEDELEIDELLFLFKRWAKKSVSNVTESFLLDLIRHFYPSIVIEDNKYFLKIRNTLWNKRVDVINSLGVYKLVCSENKQLYSICSAYKYYISQPTKNYLVSKKYFERVTLEEFGETIDADGMFQN